VCLRNELERLACRHVVEKILHRCVHRFRVRMVEALHDAVRADERHLDRLRRERRDAPVFLERHVTHELEPLHHRTAVHHRRSGGAEIRHVEARERLAAGAARLVALHALTGRLVPAHCQAEAVLEVEPAQLAVGDDLQPHAFLQLEVAADAGDFDRLELGSRHAAGFEARSRILPHLGPQEAADDIGADALELSHA
jgi:hypothetical protein